ncbi:MAG: HU family DNA-binding protein [Gammaproteobacteria bacterium]
MNKKEFIDMIADKANLTKKDAEIALQAVTDSLTELLAKGDSIVLPGFASIAVKKRAARKGRNPSTGKPIDIPASNAVSFKAGAKLKEAMNG